ncbi:hypothetical protein [Haloglomus salinum]|jgi:hypothetical protein|uniref:hypothetical protein n=1 Tax=Haloglomus salinum TaxID=2962673 RepID=UPI0020C96698|nr:hypothetical protein [Haloglomus salinum]
MASLGMILLVGFAVLVGVAVLGIGLRFTAAIGKDDVDADEAVDRTQTWARGLVAAVLGGAFASLVFFADVAGGLFGWLGNHPLAGSNLLTAALGALGLRGFIGISAVQLVAGAILVVVVVYLATRTSDETGTSAVGFLPVALLNGLPMQAAAAMVAIAALVLIAVYTVSRLRGSDDDPSLRAQSSGTLGSVSFLVSGIYAVALLALVAAGASKLALGRVPVAVVVILGGLVAVHAAQEVQERRD